MARRLEGKTFYMSSNNGVTGVIEAEALEKNTFRNRLICQLKELAAPAYLPAIRGAVEAVLPEMGPTFTFVSTRRAQSCCWYVGDDELLGKLRSYIEAEGGKIKYGGGYIPFSNGYETGLGGEELMRSELQYITTPQQFLSTFGVTAEELQNVVV